MSGRRETKTKQVTLHDVARLANVSIATVSAVVNGKNGVSAKLTKQVKEAMANLDYHPDLIARSLKVGRTHTIGMIVPDVTKSFSHGSDAGSRRRSAIKRLFAHAVQL